MGRLWINQIQNRSHPRPPGILMGRFWIKQIQNRSHPRPTWNPDGTALDQPDPESFTPSPTWNPDGAALDQADPESITASPERPRKRSRPASQAVPTCFEIDPEAWQTRPTCFASGPDLLRNRSGSFENAPHLFAIARESRRSRVRRLPARFRAAPKCPPIRHVPNFQASGSISKPSASSAKPSGRPAKPPRPSAYTTALVRSWTDVDVCGGWRGG